MSKRQRHGGSRANRGTPSKFNRVFGYGCDDTRWKRVAVDAWVKVDAHVERRDGSGHGRIELVGWQRDWWGWSHRHPAVFVRYSKLDGSKGSWSSLPMTVREFYLDFREVVEPLEQTSTSVDSSAVKMALVTEDGDVNATEYDSPLW